MHQVMSLKKIIPIFCFVLVFIGCAGDKTISQNDVIGLTAENVPEGIRITLDHIPPETDHIAIFMTTEGRNAHGLLAEFLDWDTFPFGSSSLKELKETRTLVCPFVQNGLNYSIRAYVHINDGSFTSYEASAEIIPDNGILFVPDGITMKLNETKTGAALSAFPELSYGVRYDIESKYTYLIHSEEDDFPVEGDFGDLTFDFSKSLDEFKAGSTLYNITPYRHLKYDNVTWSLNFCEPEFFNASL